MYIKNIYLKDFRNFISTSMNFKPDVNVIFGGPGSGKSNLLHGIIIAMNHSNLFIPDMPKINFTPIDARRNYIKEGKTYVKEINWPEIDCSAYLHEDFTWSVFKYNYTAATMVYNQPEPNFSDVHPVFNYFYPYIEDRDICEHRRSFELLNKFMNEFEFCKIICDEHQLEAIYISEDIYALHYLDFGRKKLINMFLAIASQMHIANNYKIKCEEVPGVVLIDDAEAFLHPAWQKKLLPTLAKFFPKVQFIATTTSPFVMQGHVCRDMNNNVYNFKNASIDDINKESI